jgi:hypothetical protein
MPAADIGRHLPVSGPTPPGTEGTISAADSYEILHPIFGKHWQMADAIANAESSRNTKARNVNPDAHRSVDRGWFQINSYWHPEVSDACAYNAFCSARAAYRISKGGTDWSQWATESIARAHAGDAKVPNADSGFLGTGIGSPSGVKVPGISDVGGFLAKLAVIFTGGFWMRVLLGLGGLLLILLGLVAVFRGMTIGAATKALRPKFSH